MTDGSGAIYATRESTIRDTMLGELPVPAPARVIPFLKWAGGKRWLTSSQRLPVPAKFNRYIEPFLGGGAVFFHLRPTNAIIADVNAELIDLYEAIKAHPNELQSRMDQHQALHSHEHYYATRSAVPTGALERAARTLYLNRTCWNGLYRVNLKGEFNVPIGGKTTVVFDGEDFGAISAALAGAEIRCADFESTIDLAKEGDFVFVDPPYTVQHNFNGFVKYNERIFSWADQQRLRDTVQRALARGAAVVVTNADHESVHKLYDGVCEYRSLSRASVLSADAAFRGQTTEALFVGNMG